MSELINDLKRMSVSAVNDEILLDLMECTHVCSGRIVLLIITRFQHDVRNKEMTRTVEVRISNTDTRYYRISDQIDALALQEHIFRDKILQGFTKMT